MFLLFELLFVHHILAFVMFLLPGLSERQAVLLAEKTSRAPLSHRLWHPQWGRRGFLLRDRIGLTVPSPTVCGSLSLFEVDSIAESPRVQ